MILFRFHEVFLQFSIFLVARTWYVYEYVSRGNTVAWKQECFSKNQIKKRIMFQSIYALGLIKKHSSIDHPEIMVV